MVNGLFRNVEVIIVIISLNPSYTKNKNDNFWAKNRGDRFLNMGTPVTGT